MKYRQLTPEQRYQIAACLRIGMNQNRIAEQINVHRSTVSRELRRNASGRWHYNPARAIRFARERHERKRKRRVDAALWVRVESLLRLQWSPEQISNRLKLEGLPSVSHEAIYQHVYREMLDGGDLHLHLRRRHTYRRRMHKYCKRGFKDPRRPIGERPAVVETRSRLGDWEADTIVGGRRRQAILSLVERRSRFCLLGKVPDRSGGAVADAACQKLLPLRGKVLTITADNGPEFARHKAIAQRLGADFFFADPYSAWQRGTVENTNGLVRQYIPKGSDLARLPDETVQLVADRLNGRPRKCLGFRTPGEVFANKTVALVT